MDAESWTGDKNHKHVLGQTREVILPDGRHVIMLELYRHAVNLEDERPAEVDVIGPLLGEMPVQCDVEGCNFVGIWRLGHDAMREMLARRAKRNDAARIHEAKLADLSQRDL